MIISFKRTADALLAGNKTVTRRDWSDYYGGLWLKAHAEGRWVHQAWDNSPRVASAKKIADIKLTQPPYQERLADMPDSDLAAEGGLWADKNEFIAQFGGDPELVVWVVRFELVKPVEAEDI